MLVKMENPMGGGNVGEFWIQLNPSTYSDPTGCWMFMPRELVKTMKFRNSDYYSSGRSESYKWGYCTSISLGTYYNYAYPDDFVQTETGTSVTSDADTTGWLTVDMSLIPSSAKYICIKKTTTQVYSPIQVVCNY